MINKSQPSDHNLQITNTTITNTTMKRWAAPTGPAVPTGIMVHPTYMTRGWWDYSSRAPSIFIPDYDQRLLIVPLPLDRTTVGDDSTVAVSTSILPPCCEHHHHHTQALMENGIMVSNVKVSGGSAKKD